MRQFVLFVMVVSTLAACSPYRRYSDEAHNRKIQPSTGAPIIPYNDYLRLGRIIGTKLGTPYVGASQWTRGTDCSGLTLQVFAEIGVPLARTAEDQWKNGVPVARNRVLFGDLLFFSLKPNRISHVGIYVGHGEFVHASEKLGVIRSRLNDKYWSKSFVGARRVLTPRPR